MSENFRHMKIRCAGCEQTTVEMTKEHVFPKWLIIRTGTNKTGIRWGNKIIPALSVTVPLCKSCNQAFGKYLEAPIKKVFDDLESQKGISDIEADLLVRWLWKLEGYFGYF